MMFFPLKHAVPCQHCSPECQPTLRKHQKVHSVKSDIFLIILLILFKIIWTDNEIHRNYSSTHVAQPLVDCKAFSKILPRHPCNNMHVILVFPFADSVQAIKLQLLIASTSDFKVINKTVPLQSAWEHPGSVVHVYQILKSPREGPEYLDLFQTRNRDQQ